MSNSKSMRIEEEGQDVMCLSISAGDSDTSIPTCKTSDTPFPARAQGRERAHSPPVHWASEIGRPRPGSFTLSPMSAHRVTLRMLSLFT